MSSRETSIVTVKSILVGLPACVGALPIWQIQFEYWLRITAIIAGIIASILTARSLLKRGRK